MRFVQHEPVGLPNYSLRFWSIRFWMGLSRLMAFLASLGTFGGAGTAARAEAEVGPVNFVLWNGEPGQMFDEAAWSAATAAISLRGFDSVSFVITSAEPVEELMRTARAADPRETLVVLTTLDVGTTTPEAFAEMMQKVDAIEDDPLFAQAAILLDVPACRVMQQVMGPKDYVPIGLVITGSDSAAKADCYTRAAELHSRRAEGWDLDANGDRVPAIDPTAETSQDLMPVAYSLGWQLVDASDPDRRAKRADNVFASGDEIIIRTSLDYVRKRGAGRPGAQFKIELDIEIKTLDGALIQRMEDVRVFEGEVTHRVPVDADYFRNWIVASVRLTEPGTYKAVFLLTDRMAPEDMQVPVPIEFDVVVR
jgi:hypothetical protein